MPHWFAAREIAACVHMWIARFLMWKSHFLWWTHVSFNGNHVSFRWTHVSFTGNHVPISGHPRSFSVNDVSVSGNHVSFSEKPSLKFNPNGTDGRARKKRPRSIFATIRKFEFERKNGTKKKQMSQMKNHVFCRWKILLNAKIENFTPVPHDKRTDEKPRPP